MKFAVRRTALAALLAVSGAAGAQEVMMRTAVFVPQNTTFGEMCSRFIAHVNAEGKGQLQMRLVGGPEAVPSFEQGNAVRTGVLDMACVPPAYYTNVMPEADAQILATISTIQQKKSGAWAALQKATAERFGGVHLLGAYGDGVQFHAYTLKPVSKIADIKALKLRTTPNFTPFFTTLGAALVNTAPGEVQTALERGVVDGYGWPSLGIFDLGWAKHTKYRIDPGFYTVIVNVLVHGKKWASLTDAQRNVLNKASEWLDEDNAKWVKEKVGAEIKRQAEAGIQTVNLGPEYRKQAYDAYWTEMTKRAPEQTKALRALFDK